MLPYTNNFSLSSILPEGGMPPLSSLYPAGAVNWSLEQGRQIWSYGKESYGELFEQKIQQSPKSTPPVLVYPLDLGSSPEHQFSIRFEIYETGGINLQRRRFIQDKFNQDVIESIEQSGGSLSSKQFLALGGAAATPFAEALSLNDLLNPTESSGTGRDTFTEEQTGLDALTEHVATVYLYLPGTINFGYKMDYQDVNTSSLEIGKLLRSLTETQTAEGGALQAELARKLGFAGLRAADQFTSFLGGSETLLTEMSLKTRQIENPFNVHLFKGVTRRSFKFSFNLIPRSYGEAKAIEAITRIFRQYAHPKRSPAGRFLDFPAEFSISFLYKNQENIRLPRIRKCALTGINLTYGENTFTATKPDPTGMVSPTKATLELEFSELEVLTQQSITDQGA